MQSNCGMIDVPFSGNLLSWVGRRGQNVIRCRLDRSMGNEDWHDKFSHTKAEYLRFMGSDHLPVLTRMTSVDLHGTQKFRFEPNFENIIKEGWAPDDSDPNLEISDRISLCRKLISRWRNIDQQNTGEAIESLKEELDRLQSDDSATLEEVTEAQDKLRIALADEEVFWQQKNRVLWLVAGDQNT